MQITFTLLKAWLGRQAGGVLRHFLLGGGMLFLNTKCYVIFSIVELNTVLLLFSKTTEGSLNYLMIHMLPVGNIRIG